MLIAEIERLAAEIAHLRAHVRADPRQPKTEIEMQMEALRIALLEVLAPPERITPNCSGTAVSTMPREEPRLPRAAWDLSDQCDALVHIPHGPQHDARLDQALTPG